MQFPTLEKVETAEPIQLADWYAVLPFAETESERKIIDRIVRRIADTGFQLPAFHRTDVEIEEDL